MHLRINKNSQVYRYWTERRRAAGIRSLLSQSVICVLAYLEHHGEAYQIQIADDNNLNQGNLSARYMPTLVKMQFVHMIERPGMGSQGGGRAGKVYQISPQGRRFLELLRAYDGGIAVWDVTGESPYFVQGRGRNVRPSTLSQAG